MDDTVWLNRTEYPFKPYFFRTSAGDMHYVDEGKGEPIVFIHGNPSWSFEFRVLIKELSKTYRCIAPDHIGFGLSDKPGQFSKHFSYLPVEHARNLEAFLESLDLKGITLVFEDWGGPIGLSYALNHPEKTKNIVIINTWMWSVRSDWYYQAFSNFVGGPIGRHLIKKYNFFAKTIVRSVFGDKKKLTPQIHKHYLMPLNDPGERKGSWVFPKEIIGSSDWLQSLWDKRYILNDKNILIAWGMKDIAFGKKELNRWTGSFSQAKVIRFPGSGHFVAEENPDELIAAIREFIEHHQ